LITLIFIGRSVEGTIRFGIIGLRYSLAYLGFGVETVRRAPPESRGLATGAYTAFLDLAFGLANPALGLVAVRG
jgi:hypothetical protein